MTKEKKINIEEIPADEDFSCGVAVPVSDEILEFSMTIFEGCFGGTWYMKKERLNRIGREFFESLSNNEEFSSKFSK